MTNADLAGLKKHVTPRNDAPFNAYLETLMGQTENTASKPNILPHNQEALLSSVGRFPCLDRKERQQMLGWNAQTMQNAIDALTNNEYIRPVKTKKGGRGSSYTAYALTDKAKRYMLSRQIHFVKLHGSLEHHCAIERWMQAKKEAGYKVLREPRVGNSIIDALAEREVTIGLEVVASDNLKRDKEKFVELLSQIDQLEVLCLSSDLAKIYTKQLKKQLSDGQQGVVHIRSI